MTVVSTGEIEVAPVEEQDKRRVEKRKVEKEKKYHVIIRVACHVDKTMVK
jgi:hypothetical protein